MWNRYALNSTVNTLVTGTYHIHFFCWHHSCSGLLSILPGQSEHCIYRKSQIPNGPSQEKYSVAIHFGFSHFRSSGLNRCQNRTYGEKSTWRLSLLLFCLRRCHYVSSISIFNSSWSCWCSWKSRSVIGNWLYSILWTYTWIVDFVLPTWSEVEGKS